MCVFLCLMRGVCTKKLLPLFIDVRRVVLDLQEGNGRRAVDEVRFNNIRVKPHVETVPVLVQRLPVVEAPANIDRALHMASRGVQTIFIKPTALRRRRRMS